MLRQGSGEPLVLFHGLTGAERMWRHVLPLLAPAHDTVALTLMGHCGGAPMLQRPATIAHAVDDAEQMLDGLGFERPHLAGNSMGGWVALELARRGRARSVCALSPAGTWVAGTPEHERSRSKLQRTLRDTRRGRLFLPLLARSRRFRRTAFRNAAEHGDRLTPTEIVDTADDLIGCSAAEDILATTEQLAPMDPLPCHISIAWAENDRILPLKINGRRARELFPGAQFTVLPDVGHVPMFDDPQLVADTILATARQAAAGAPRRA
jgi:pimeloyl-ACP methyl ester carboxylesterase